LGEKKNSVVEKGGKRGKVMPKKGAYPEEKWKRSYEETTKTTEKRGEKISRRIMLQERKIRT